MLPTFLGIGVAKCGTTWLHDLLEHHPDVYVPKHRKEIGYFNKQFHRPIEWYESYFPPDGKAGRYKAIGEIAPQYWGLHIPQRLLEVSSIKKLIVMFRDPVDCIYSNYCWVRQIKGHHGSLEDFLSRPRGIKLLEAVHYCRMLQEYLKVFDRQQFLILISEQTFADVEAAKKRIADFLDVDLQRFEAGAGQRVVNKRMSVKHHTTYLQVRRLGRAIRHVGLDAVTNYAKRLGIERYFMSSDITIEPMSKQIRHDLEQKYADDIEALESLVGIDLDCWKSRRPRHHINDGKS